MHAPATSTSCTQISFERVKCRRKYATRGKETLYQRVKYVIGEWVHQPVLALHRMHTHILTYTGEISVFLISFPHWNSSEERRRKVGSSRRKSESNLFRLSLHRIPLQSLSLSLFLRTCSVCILCLFLAPIPLWRVTVNNWSREGASTPWSLVINRYTRKSVRIIVRLF